MTAFRLPEGGGVDRGRTLAFTFDGKPYRGFEGDSIASALLANGVRVVGRSFKYHRPRGIWGAWTEEPNAIVDVTRAGRTTPNLRATTEALENDLAARSVNAASDRGGRSRRADRQVLGLHAVGLLLQDVSLAALGDVRARDPRDCRPRPRRSGQSPVRPTIRSSMRAATCSSSAPARPASPRRRRRRIRAASCSSSTTAPTSAGSSFTAAARSRAETGAAGPEASARRSRRTADG